MSDGDFELEAVITAKGEEARLAHDDVLPDIVTVVFRRFGSGGRWEARGPVTTAYCGQDQVEAYRQAWWLVWCDEEYHRRRQPPEEPT